MAEIKEEPIELHYDVQEELGRGRFAVVKKCVNKKTGELFAAKFVRKARQGRSCREQLLLEIDILHTSSHPKMVRLYDVFETRKEMIIIIEYAPGGDLHRHCLEEVETVRTEKEICYLIRQIVEAVRYLHDNNVVHLDLKPENILLSSEERFPEIRLIDFGLSRRLDKPYSQFDIVGTPEYVAPEVLSFEPLEFASDMWSIGVVAYVLLSGISPFAGDEVMETYQNVAQVDYDFDAEEFDEISDDAKDFIEKLLIRKPKSRLSSRESLEHPWLRQMENGFKAEDIAAALVAEKIVYDDESEEEEDSANESHTGANSEDALSENSFMKSEGTVSSDDNELLSCEDSNERRQDEVERDVDSIPLENAKYIFKPLDINDNNKLLQSDGSLDDSPSSIPSVLDASDSGTPESDFGGNELKEDPSKNTATTDLQKHSHPLRKMEEFRLESSSSRVGGNDREGTEPADCKDNTVSEVDACSSVEMDNKSEPESNSHELAVCDVVENNARCFSGEREILDLSSHESSKKKQSSPSEALQEGPICNRRRGSGERRGSGDGSPDHILPKEKSQGNSHSLEQWNSSSAQLGRRSSKESVCHSQNSALASEESQKKGEETTNKVPTKALSPSKEKPHWSDKRTSTELLPSSARRSSKEALPSSHRRSSKETLYSQGRKSSQEAVAIIGRRSSGDTLSSGSNDDSSVLGVPSGIDGRESPIEMEKILACSSSDIEGPGNKDPEDLKTPPHTAGDISIHKIVSDDKTGSLEPAVDKAPSHKHTVSASSKRSTHTSTTASAEATAFPGKCEKGAPNFNLPLKSPKSLESGKPSSASSSFSAKFWGDSEVSTPTSPHGTKSLTGDRRPSSHTGSKTPQSPVQGGRTVVRQGITALMASKFASKEDETKSSTVSQSPRQSSPTTTRGVPIVEHKKSNTKVSEGNGAKIQTKIQEISMKFGKAQSSEPPAVSPSRHTTPTSVKGKEATISTSPKTFTISSMRSASKDASQPFEVSLKAPKSNTLSHSPDPHQREIALKIGKSPSSHKQDAPQSNAESLSHTKQSPKAKSQKSGVSEEQNGDIDRERLDKFPPEKTPSASISRSKSLRRKTSQGSPSSPRKTYRKLYVTHVRGSKSIDVENDAPSEVAEIRQNVEQDGLKVKLLVKCKDLQVGTM